MPEVHARFSPSSAERLIHCPPSLVLGEECGPEDNSTEYTAEGTEAGLAADLSSSKGAAVMFETAKRLKAQGKLPDLDYCILYKWGIHIDCGGKRKSLWEVRA